MINGYINNNGPNLIIGDGTSIGRFFQVNSYLKVEIKENVLIADRVFISDVDHQFRNPEIAIIKQGVTEPKPTVIKQGAWIGIGAVITPGVSIGKNAVVGANAVVTKDVPDNHIALGVPSRMKPIKEFTKTNPLNKGAQH